MVEERLTPAEHRVLVIAAEGLTNRETAEKIGCSPLTVKAHLQNIRWKLRASSTAHAVFIALKTGVLTLDEVTS